jgi:hypothetical protein
MIDDIFILMFAYEVRFYKYSSSPAQVKEL